MMMTSRLLTAAFLATALLALASPSEATCRAVSLNYTQPTHKLIVEAACELAEPMGVDEIRIAGQQLTFRFSPDMANTLRMGLLLAARPGPEQAATRKEIAGLAKSFHKTLLAFKDMGALRPTRLRLVGPTSEWLMTIASDGTYSAATR